MGTQRKENHKKDLTEKVEADLSLLPILFEGVSSSEASVRYGCASVLMELTARHAEKMYPYMDQFVDLLNSKHRIITWNAMAAISNLCGVDKDKKFDAAFDKYYSFLENEYLATVANVVSNSAKIALAKPYLLPKITCKLLSVENLRTTPHLTVECKRVVAEKAIDVFSVIAKELTSEDRSTVFAFVKRQTKTPRRSLMVKAENLMKQWGQL